MPGLKHVLSCIQRMFGFVSARELLCCLWHYTFRFCGCLVGFSRVFDVKLSMSVMNNYDWCLLLVFAPVTGCIYHVLYARLSVISFVVLACRSRARFHTCVWLFLLRVSWVFRYTSNALF